MQLIFENKQPQGHADAANIIGKMHTYSKIHAIWLKFSRTYFWQWVVLIQYLVHGTHYTRCHKGLNECIIVFPSTALILFFKSL